MARCHALFVLLLAGCGNLPKHGDGDAGFGMGSGISPPAFDAGFSPFDALPDAATTATGPHHHYVMSAEHVPTSPDQARDLSLDIGGQSSNQPDGVTDNQLGQVIAVFAGQGIDIQGAVDTSVAHGDTLMLIDVQAVDLAHGDDDGFVTMLGDDPSPPPCNGPSDTTCGHHLSGTGSFDVVAGSAGTQAIGDGGGNGLDAANGAMVVQLALGPAQPVALHLQNVRVHATGLADAGFASAIVDGAVSTDEIASTFVPALQVGIEAIVQRDCPGTDPSSTPACGCAAGSEGATFIGLFDTGPKDCQVSLTELQQNGLLRSLLAPDVCIEGACMTPDGLSLGVELVGVTGTFSFP